MGILRNLLFLSVLSNVYACPSSYCGTFSLDYPFKLQTSTPPNSCHYINLSCNDTNPMGSPILSLPYSGDFAVRYIGYSETYIELYDPGDCLMGRLMKLNLSSSPFKAIELQKYTFYTCPYGAPVERADVLPINCLGNGTRSTVATSVAAYDGILRKSGCDAIGSWKLPVWFQNQFEYEGISSDLYLKWDNSTCSACEHKDTGDYNNLWTTFVGSTYFIPSFLILVTFLITCFLQMVKLVAGRYGVALMEGQPESASAATAPPGSTAGGLDESKIESCTELVAISESRINIGPDYNTCSICLESYVAQESVRSIAKCEHLFHAECIELWLRKNRTCPVCRTDVVEL